jgi:Flp pilus assembly protein TadG
MIEAVIVLPVVLMVLFAIVEFSIVFSRWQTLTNAAREGARTAIVYRSTCDTTQVENTVRGVSQAYATAGGITLADSDVAITGVCGATNTNSSVTVTSDYQYRVIRNMAAGLNSTITITGSSVMRNE